VGGRVGGGGLEGSGAVAAPALPRLQHHDRVFIKLPSCSSPHPPFLPHPPTHPSLQRHDVRLVSAAGLAAQPPGWESLRACCGCRHECCRECCCDGHNCDA
jgi:hypothetical protein